MVVWTLVVTLSVFVVTGFTVAFRLMIDCGPESIALVVNRIKSAVELRVVTESAGIAVGIRCSKISADIVACIGCVSYINVWIALVVHEVARTANFAVVAVAVFLTVIAIEFAAHV